MSGAAAEHPLVIKLGGRELHPNSGIEAMASLVARRVRAGRPTLLVHGGGEEITDRAAALGLRSVHEAGQRVTSAPMLEIVTEVLAGRINVRLVQALMRAGVPAVGISGASDRLITVTPAGDPPGSLGWVGKPRAVNGRVLRLLLADGIVPVVAPFGVDRKGNLYNVNADLTAGAIAGALGAELALVTNVPGVEGADHRLLPELSVAGARRLRETGVVTDGMIPKLEAAEAALRGGARTAWIGTVAGLGQDGVNRSSGTLVRIGPPSAAAIPRPSLRPLATRMVVK